MQVFIDYQVFQISRFGGVCRYFSELVNRYYNDPEIELQLGFSYTDAVYLHSDITKPLTYQYKLPKVLRKWGNRKIKQYKLKHNATRSRNYVQKGDFDIFHPSFYGDYFLKDIENKPYVLTIYDLIYEKLHEQYSGLNDGSIERKRTLAKNASAIIAISESTRRDILEIYGIPEEKVTTVYLGPSFDAMPPIEDKSPYILYVGAREMYKNFTTTLIGIADVLKQKNFKLICAGGTPFSSEELELIGKNGIASLVEQKSVSDSELITLYQSATAFIYPSLYEGFGIPILEAFACGCPALLSNSSCFPEIAGNDAALYFDPRNSDEIQAVTQKIIEQEDVRKQLISEGYKRLKEYSWDRCVSETKSVYTKVIENEKKGKQ